MKRRRRRIQTKKLLVIALAVTFAIALIPFTGTFAAKADENEPIEATAEEPEFSAPEEPGAEPAVEAETTVETEPVASSPTVPTGPTVPTVPVARGEGLPAGEGGSGAQEPISIAPAAQYNIDIGTFPGGGLAYYACEGVWYNGFFDCNFEAAGATGNSYVITQTGGQRPFNLVFEDGVNTTVTLNGINIMGNITLLGNANVTILLGGTNTIQGSVIAPQVFSGNSSTIATLTIDSAATAGSATGTLRINNLETTRAGIGGAINQSGGVLNFNGGTIEVDLSAGLQRSAAAIGGGQNLAGTGGGGGTITINNNCVVTAKNNNAGAGIGGGQNGSGGTITINGGTVTASSVSAAGIGSGQNTGLALAGDISAGVITINGGTVMASTSTSGAAIGTGAVYPGNRVDSGTIRITGGSVTATGGMQGTGIGGGGLSLSGNNTYVPGTISIEGGTVVASGATGIGGGTGGGPGGTINITGGNVTASGDTGIGGGYMGGAGGTISITGGTVVAKGDWGSGIGGGYQGAGAALTIGPSANIKAYSRGNEKPAIDANGPISGNGYYVNALFNEIISANNVDIYVFPNAYSGGNPNDRINELTLPGGYRAFGYNTGGAQRTDNIYASLTSSDIRVIDRVFDNSKLVPSINNLNGYNAYNPPADAGKGVLPVKLRLAPVAGTPSVDNVEKYSADLTSTGHTVGTHTFLSGGFYYSSTASSGRPSNPTDLPWGITTLVPNPITRNTETDAAVPGTKLVPNTRYYAIAYLKADIDLWLSNPTNPTYESDLVVQFVTKPSITSGSVAAGNAPGETVLGAQFEGGQEALTARIYYSTAYIDKNNPGTWPSTYRQLTASEFNYTGFSNYRLDGLTPGLVYNYLIVIENETGWDSYELNFVDSTGVTISDVVAGSFADRTKPFTYTVYILDSSGAPLPSGTSFDYVGGVVSGSGAVAPPNGTLVLDSTSKATVDLKHGQMITIVDVLANEQIRIVETVVSDYTVTYTDSVDGLVTTGNDTGAKTVGANARRFDFVNTHSTVTPTDIPGDWTWMTGLLLLAFFVLMDWMIIRYWRSRKWTS